MKPIIILVILFTTLISFSLRAQVTNPYSKSKHVESEIKKYNKKEKKKSEEQKDQTSSTELQSDSNTENPQLVWSKYDFVPGEKVIFEASQQFFLHTWSNHMIFLYNLGFLRNQISKFFKNVPYISFKFRHSRQFSAFKAFLLC